LGACSITTGSVSFTGAGTCVIDANQAGNASYNPAGQQQQTITVNSASLLNQTIAFTSLNPSPVTVGATAYVPAATGGASGNPVVFTIDASSTLGACSITTGSVSFTGAGTCVIDANQAGNASYNPAGQQQQTITVNSASLLNQTIAFTSLNPSPVTVGATAYVPAATGGASGNPVVFTIDASSTLGACSITTGSVSFTGAGTCVIDANQAGNASYNPAGQQQQTITVNSASLLNQTIAFTSLNPSPVTVGATAYVPAATGGASGNPVVFTIDASSTLGACSITTGSVSFTGAGTCVIDANQAGNASYNPAGQQQQTITVNSASLLNQTIAFTSLNPSPVTVGATAYVPAATGGASGNPVVFTIDASSTLGACSITTGSVSFTGAGTCVIDANQAGNASYNPAGQQQQTITVNSASLLNQTIAFTSLNPSPVTVGATAYVPAATGGASGNPVVFTIDASSAFGACSITTGSVSFTGAGTCVIDANQAGNSSYNPAGQQQQTITVNSASLLNQTIAFTSLNPSPVTVGATAYVPAATG